MFPEDDLNTRSGFRFEHRIITHDSTKVKIRSVTRMTFNNYINIYEAGLSFTKDH